MAQENLLNNENTVVQDAPQSPCVSSAGSVVESQKSRKRKFLFKWKEEFKWLEYNVESGVARCSVCPQFKRLCDSSSRVVNGFKEPFRHETFKFHNLSAPHRRCMEALDGQKQPDNSSVAKCLKTMDEKMFFHLEVLFNISFYIAKNNKPFTDLRGLAELAGKLNVEVLEGYTNNKQCKEFIHYIAQSLKEDVVADIKASEFVSVLVDGSTGRSDVEECIIYVRYINASGVKESYLAIAPLANSTALGYLDAVDEEFQRVNMDWRHGKCLVGLATDGSPLMIGGVNDLASKITNYANRITTIHCVSHKVHLSVLKSLKGVSYIDEIDHCLISVYKFYNGSSKRQKQLSETAEVLSAKLLKLQKLHTVRWVASKVGTIKAVIQDWRSLVTHLENVGCGKETDSSKAKGVLKTLKKYRFLRTLHFLHDFLFPLKKLSLTFQKPDLLINQVQIHIKKTIASLEELEKTPGPMENEFINNTSVTGMYHEIQLDEMTEGQKKFECDRKEIIEIGMADVKRRFLKTATDDILTSMSIFDTFTWPEKSLGSFGKEEVTTLVSHYKDLLQHAGKEDIIQKALDEWHEFKICAKTLSSVGLMGKVMKHHGGRFPVLLQLLKIASVLPVSAASCERGYSQMMSLMKNKFRSCLETESLDDLMMVNLNGPPLPQFNPTKAIDKWYFSAKTPRHVRRHKGNTSDSSAFSTKT
ncbi:zinc finger protein 862-like [Pogona vitticeps]